MKNITFFTVTTIFMLLTACNDGSSSSGSNTQTPTDKNLSFQTFPNDYFNIGYQEKYHLTGQVYSYESQKSLPIEMNITRVTEEETVFNNSQAIPITTSSSTAITNSETGETYDSTSTSSSYYLPTTDNILYLGYDNCYPSSQISIPKTIKIGDNITASCTNEAGETEYNYWHLEDGFNGKAKIVIETITKDQYEQTIYSGIETYLITPDGKRLSYSLNLVKNNPHLKIELQGNKE